MTDNAVAETLDFVGAMERIASSLPGYEVRPQQVALAQQIETAIQDENISVLAAQAGCIQGDAEIVINRNGEVWPITLANLVARVTGVKVPGASSGRRFKAGIETYVQREVDGVVRLGRLVSAWCSGVKTTYTVTTETGRSIRATDEHPFLTERGWLRLDELLIGDEVHVKGTQASGLPSPVRVNYKQVYGLGCHPFAIEHNAHSSRYPLHRLVAEASLNGIDLELFEKMVRDGDTAGLIFINPKTHAVHHIDMDQTNNALSNLSVMTHSAHHALHSELGGARNVLFKVITEKVLSVERFGDEMTYDIEVDDDPHNFIANGFVVHNTGVGKSLAALIPAILSGQRTVYSTATKALQSQIAEKDLPFLAEHLGVPFTYAMLKGWGSYVCSAKLNLMEPSNVKVAIRKALDGGHDGDRDGLSATLTNAQWAEMSTSTDECPGVKSCPFGMECRPNEARVRAKEARVVVVNHAVLAINAKLEEEAGFGLLLQSFDVLVADEVHLLEDVISGVLTGEFTIRSITSLVNKILSISRKYAAFEADHDELERRARALVVSSEALLATLNDGRMRQRWIFDHVDPFETVLIQLTEIYELVVKAEAAGVDVEVEALAASRLRKQVLSREVSNKIRFFRDLIMRPDLELVRIVEIKEFRGDRTVLLRTVPVDIGDWAKEYIWDTCTTSLLISATVFVNGKADFITKRLGIKNARTFDAGTAFDFEHQARLYIPQIVDPSPANRAAWSKAILHEIPELIMASSGRALVLFTSSKEMHAAYDALHRQIPYPVRCQGDDSAAAMARWFQETTEGVLFATRTFFQGSDFSGETCSLVIIDKLPFPVPSDPIIESRSERIEREGGYPFKDLTIPLMSLTLAQAFGRLIRTKVDFGCVAILDSRLCDKSYGPGIVKSLPPAPLVRTIREVTEFFDGLASKL